MIWFEKLCRFCQQCMVETTLDSGQILQPNCTECQSKILQPLNWNEDVRSSNTTTQIQFNRLSSTSHWTLQGFFYTAVFMETRQKSVKKNNNNFLKKERSCSATTFLILVNQNCILLIVVLQQQAFRSWGTHILKKNVLHISRIHGIYKRETFVSSVAITDFV